MKWFGSSIAVLTLLLAAGWTNQSARVLARAKLPSPALFKLPASSLPWHAPFLLDARSENNKKAAVDGDLIYNTAFGGPSWSKLHRAGGWYEDALMKQSGRSAVAEILVSEFSSTARAKAAHKAELHNIESYRKLTARPSLSSESEEFASSSILKQGGTKQRVEDSIISTRDKNLELDVDVFDAHTPGRRWLQFYRAASVTIAKRMVKLANDALSPAPTSTPTSTSTPAQPPTPTQTPTSAPTPTATDTTVVTATPTDTALATATATNTAPAENVQVSASVSNEYPSDNSTETVYGTLTANGQGVAGVTMNTTWYYKSTTVGCSGMTDASGSASCSRDISTATKGYTVLVEVSFAYNGQTYTTSTSFTPE